MAIDKKMLIESDPHQVRIAVLEADRLTEIFVERLRHRGVVGNVYKGRVTRVLPGMQAAFVDIGLERDAFLYVSDVVESDVVELDAERVDEAAATEAVGEPADLAASGPAAASAERSAANGGERSIEELLQSGQEVLVQVTKDALANKGARVSTHITLPSRNLVLLPTVRHVGVSRRIEDEAERERLRGLLEALGTDAGGLIVRTAGEGRSADELAVDRRYLAERWQRIRELAERTAAPTMIHRDQDLALRVVRDLFTDEYSVLWVDSAETYQRVVEFLGNVQPELASRVKLDRHEARLFERFRIEEEIEAALASKVWLRSGGYLVINQTEALVAIDVNTGRFVGQHSLEDTVLRTNLEAVEEIVRQIRLRDLSGIVVIDLIDMNEQEHRDQVFAALELELRRDRAKSQVLNLSEFGLVELTRKRSHANLERLLTRRCPYCQGSGRIKTLATICLNIRTAVLRTVREGPAARELLLRVHPEVAQALQTEERALLDELERSVGARLLLHSVADFHHERFELTEA